MSGGGTNTVSSTTIPSEILPYYQSALGQGQSLDQSGGPQYYPGQQVAPLNSLQEQGLDTASQGVPMAQQAYGVAQAGVPMAMQGYGIAQQGVPMAQQGYNVAQQDYQPTNQGLSQIQQTAAGPNASQGAQQANEFETSGALLNPASNPYLQQTFQQGANQVQNALSSQFGAAGRNTLASAPVQSDEMNNLATQLYGGAYNTGLNTMTQASALAPSIDAGTYQPGQQLLNASTAALNNNAGVYSAGNNILNAGNNLQNSGNNVLNAGVNLQGSANNVLNAGNNALTAGAGLQGQTQNQINANMAQWNYNQQLPYNQLSWYSGLLGTNASPFMGSSGSTTGTSNPWSTGVGTALLGNSLIPGGYAGLMGGAGAGAFAGTGATAASIGAGTAAADAAAAGAAGAGIYGAGAAAAPYVADAAMLA